MGFMGNFLGGVWVRLFFCLPFEVVYRMPYGGVVAVVIFSYMALVTASLVVEQGVKVYMASTPEERRSNIRLLLLMCTTFVGVGAGYFMVPFQSV